MKVYFWNVLLSIDQLGNALTGGHHDETISSRAAKARLQGKRWGCYLCRFLDWVDTDHCTKSIELDEGEALSAEEILRIEKGLK